MKKKIIILLIACLMLSGCGIPTTTEEVNKFFDVSDHYQINTIDSYDINACASCLKEIENARELCNKIDIVTIQGRDVTLLEAINENLLSQEELKCLTNAGVIDHYRVPYFVYRLMEFVFDIFKAIG